MKLKSLKQSRNMASFISTWDYFLKCLIFVYNAVVKWRHCNALAGQGLPGLQVTFLSKQHSRLKQSRKMIFCPTSDCFLKYQSFRVYCRSYQKTLQCLIRTRSHKIARCILAFLSKQHFRLKQSRKMIFKDFFLKNLLFMYIEERLLNRGIKIGLITAMISCSSNLMKLQCLIRIRSPRIAGCILAFLSRQHFIKRRKHLLQRLLFTTIHQDSVVYRNAAALTLITAACHGSLSKTLMHMQCLQYMCCCPNSIFLV